MWSEPREIALIGARSELQPLLEVVRRGYRPFQVVAAAAPGQTAVLPLLRDRPQVGGKGTAYVCRELVCQAPVTEASALEMQLTPA
jgi:uncharacterized protein YyaL (SSP411 family)